MARLRWRARASASFLTTLVLLPFPRQSPAAWPTDPLVNVPLCTAVGTQSYPMIVADGSAGAIVTWTDNRSGTTNSDIYAQRVTATGVPLWAANGVALCTAASYQLNPTIVADESGGAIVTWSDYRSGTWHIYAQRVNAAGVPQWTANGVALCTAAGGQMYPTIVADGAGGAIVAWPDYRSGNSDIYAQRVNAAGVPQWTADGVALCTAVHSQPSASIVADGSGGAIVTWPDGRVSTTNADIYARRVNAAGVPLWAANGVALCAATGNQLHPTIAADGSGGAIVAWDDQRSGSDHHIYAQLVSAAGVPQWTADGVALCTAPDNQLNPAIVADGSGGAIVTWQDYRDGNFGIFGIYAQRVGAAGMPLWSADGVALCAAAGNRLCPTIVEDGSGGAIVTWADYRISGTNADVYAQRVSAVGMPRWSANGVALCIAAAEQSSPTIVADGWGGAIVTWEDDRGATPDIYTQRVLANGQPGGDLPTGTLLARFDAEVRSDGVLLRWQFGTPVRSVRIERAELQVGPWMAPVVERRDDGEVSGAVDATVEPSHTYWYRLNAILGDGTSAISGPIQAELPGRLLASGVTRIAPSPTSGPMRIEYAVAQQEKVRLSVLDVAGREIDILIQGDMAPGRYSALWNSCGNRARLACGVYFLLWQSPGRMTTTRIVLVR